MLWNVLPHFHKWKQHQHFTWIEVFTIIFRGFFGYLAKFVTFIYPSKSHNSLLWLVWVLQTVFRATFKANKWSVKIGKLYGKTTKIYNHCNSYGQTLQYLNGGSLQNGFDSLRNYEDIGLSLRGWVRKIRLIRLPIGMQDIGESETKTWQWAMLLMANHFRRNINGC